MNDYLVKDGDLQILIEKEQTKMKSHVASQYVAARKRLGMTQEMVAAISGIKRPNITRFEKGDYNPTLDMLVKIAESMGMQVEINLVEKEKA